jgi:2-polyprenyl-3-methyl-5-hydroxy-6-metoxy-1,4-benzoquinol methylase
MKLSSELQTRHYARKQLFSKDRLIAWSHRARFKMALKLAKNFAGTRLLDYGCGDGTFLSLLLDSGIRPALAVGAEIDACQIEDCRNHFSGRPDLKFVHVNELDESCEGAYDTVFCMEVLEHVIDPDEVLDLLEPLIANGGYLVVSVPVETGLPVVVKQIVRRIAGWRKMGDYEWTSRYKWMELVRSVFAGRSQHISRPIYRDQGVTWHDHKGFNWRVLEEKLRTRFDKERRIVSPVAWLGSNLASQVWFVMRKRTNQ